MGTAPFGIIEGFYGPPWSWEERAALLAWGAPLGVDTYLYAPKDDPLHRARWREPYPSADLAHLEELASASTVTVGFAISPGLSIDVHSTEDRAALAAKIDAVVERGIALVCLAVDDVPVRPGLGEEHALLTRWLRDHLGDRASLVLVPTDYTSCRSTPYLDSLATSVPGDVAIAWTGTTVVADQITAAQAQARAEVLGRPPLLWDNHPVNDGLMVDRLLLSPLRGRDRALRDVLAGYLANPMPQVRASRPAIASAAAWWRGGSAEDGWRAEVDATGIRALAEGCDGEVPRQLVADLVAAGDRWQPPAAQLARWLDGAAVAEAGPLGDEAAAWLEQLGVEVQVARLALRTIQLARPAVRRDGDRARVAPPALRASVEHLMAVLATWQRARRGDVSVLGPRDSVRAVLGQHASGEWRLHREALQVGQSALDELVTHAVDVVAALDEASPTVVQVDGVDLLPTIEREGDGVARWSVVADRGAAVRVEVAGTATSTIADEQPALPDRRLV